MRNFVNEKVTCYYNILIVHHLSNLWNIKQRFSYSDSKCYSKIETWKYGLYEFLIIHSYRNNVDAYLLYVSKDKEGYMYLTIHEIYWQKSGHCIS